MKLYFFRFIHVNCKFLLGFNTPREDVIFNAKVYFFAREIEDGLVIHHIKETNSLHWN